MPGQRLLSTLGGGYVDGSFWKVWVDERGVYVGEHQDTLPGAIYLVSD